MGKKPIIAIPMGDAAGIGPEILVKALCSNIGGLADCVVVGSRIVMERAISLVGADMVIRKWTGGVEDGQVTAGKTLNLVETGGIDLDRLKDGQVSGMCGRAAYDAIAESIRLAMAGEVDAVATPPINKESLRAGGIDHIGHTEIFASLTDTPDPITLFEVRGMRVFFLTRHVSLRRACDLVTKERIVDHARRCAAVLRQLGVAEGTMAIAGLNPHSGEHGLFGDEEVLHVAPAVEQLQAEGMNVTGPIGADSVFHLALQGRFNSVLSLYHDQGHIATKTLDFDRTIAITGGMPILRTSVDHGTAFDIAWKGIASSVSMEEAIRLAAAYAPFYGTQGDKRANCDENAGC